MRDFLRYLQLTGKILLREDIWFFLIPLILLFFTGAWTLTVGDRSHWNPSLGIGQAEVLGPLLAACLCAGLLDPEKRRGAGEIIFNKPFPPALLLGVRFALMLIVTLLLLLLLLLVYQACYGNAEIIRALGYALPNCLFIGMVALTAAQFGRNAVAGYVAPLLFWLWDSTAGILYNPLFTLPLGSMAASQPHDTLLATALPWSKLALVLTALLLFGINIRWLARGGREGVSGRGPLLLRRLKTPVTALLLFGAYFYTGMLVNLGLIQRSDGERLDAGIETPDRFYQGGALIGLNEEYRNRLGIYGPAPLPSLLGRGLASFLKGLGVGLDPSQPGYRMERRRALERAIRSEGINPCRDNARLELAALEAKSAAFNSDWNALISVPIPLEEESDWVTVGLVDADRWWVTRRPSGPDPERADRLLSDVLKSHPSPGVATEALRLRASLADLRWDFRAGAMTLHELVETYPGSFLAAQTLGSVAHTMERKGQAEEALSLYQRILSQQPAQRRGSLVVGLALLQARSGNMAEARRTLQQAIAEADGDEAPGENRPSAGSDMRRFLEDALKNLDKSAVVPPPSSSTLYGGSRFSAHTRVVAEGKPLSGVMVALIPLTLAGQALPRIASRGWEEARASGSFPAEMPHISQMDGGGEAWSTDQMARLLKDQPEMFARSDDQGVVRWSSLPPGTYAVFLRMGSWQLPEGGRYLAPIPMEGPITIAVPETVIPDLRFVTALHITPTVTETGTPALHWNAVPGAVSYYAALRIDNAAQRLPMLATEAGNGAARVDPDVVWWREGIKGTSVELTPERFVGPAQESRSNGLRGGVRYNWCVEARDAAGKILRTSESRTAPVSVVAQEWTALQPTGATTQNRSGNRSSGLLTGQRMGGDAAEPNGYNSPFLMSLLVERDKVVPPVPASRRLAVAAPAATNGQGLPPRAPLFLAAPPVISRQQGAPPDRALMLSHGLPIPAQPGGSFAPGASGPPFGNAALPTGAMPATPGHIPPMLPGNPGAARSGPMVVVPPKGMPPMPLSGRPFPADSLPIPMGGRLPVPSAASDQRIVLQKFSDESLIAWVADPASAGEGGANRAEGLLYREAVTLTHREAPLALPPHTRRASLEIAEGKADAELVLRNMAGKEIRLALKAADSPSNRLEALLPEGGWALVALHLSPRNGAAIRLIALSVEVPIAPGLFTLVRSQGDTFLLELHNLGSTVEPITITTSETKPDAAYAEIDLAPQGKAVVRLPAAIFAEPLWVRWRGGSQLVAK